MNTAMPIISVVIPSYNHAHLIGRALASVLAQDWRHLDIVIVDNHSSDHTDEVVASFADPRIRLIKVHNGGVIAVSRNVGIRAAHGEWVAFLDSDDWWSSDKLVKCAKHFDGADLVYHRLRIVASGRRHVWPRCIGSWQVAKPVLQHMLMNGNPIATSSVVVRRSLLEQVGGFDERKEIVAAEDFDTWLRVAALTDRFFFVRASLGYYLFSMQSASRKDISLPMREVHAAHAHHLSAQARERMDAHAAYAAGRYAWQHSDLVCARTELRKSLRWGRADLRLKSLLMLLIMWLRKSGRTSVSGPGGR
jgi:glycosyltransferase involved in cell wall biosynthesis